MLFRQDNGEQQQKSGRKRLSIESRESTAGSISSRASGVSTISPIISPSINSRSLVHTSVGLTPMVIQKQIPGPGSSLKHRLPWLDGGTSSHPVMPGAYDDSQHSRVSSSSIEHGGAPLPLGSDSGFLQSDLSMRAIGSAPVSHRPPRPLTIRKASSMNSNTFGFAGESLPESESSSIAKSSGTSQQEEVSPTVITAASAFPPPVPARSRERAQEQHQIHGRENSLGQAVNGLENLLDNTVEIAEEAAELGRTDEVSQVLDEALEALRRASDVSARHHARMSGPLRVSEYNTESSPVSSSSEYSETDGGDEEDVGLRHDIRAGSIPRSTMIRNSEPVTDSSHHGQLAEVSVSGTPPRFYSQSSTPAARDFAQVSRTHKGDGSVIDGHRAQKKSDHAVQLDQDDLSAGASPEALHTGGSNVDNIVHPVSAMERSLRRRSEHGAESTLNAWAPKHANTSLADGHYNAKPRRRRTTRILSIADDDIKQPQRHKRHYRNLDPATPGLSLKHKNHFSLRSHQGFSFGHHARRHPVARKWHTLRKRITATIACINTGFVGFVIGVYAGEVPRIQYQIIDPGHYIIQGNVYLFIGLAVSTFFFWPLPLLHGRKPYTLCALALATPLQFPQAVFVSSVRPPSDASYRVALLTARAFTGFLLGFANINFITTLFDLFGASLQSSNPHQEIVFLDDVRRQGGGMGIWLGIWAWCFTSSVAIGFLTGAGIIANLNPAWGFYVTVIVGAFVLLLNVICPETRRSAYRRSFAEFVDNDEKVRRRIARGEVKLHLESEGPMWWGEEVWAGVRINFKMLSQWGYTILAFYTGWTYALVVLVIVLLGSLLSRNYRMRPHFIGLGVFAISVGALLAVPLSKASIFSRDRTRGPRTDSMTFERQFTWSSHMVRRIIFTLVLPLAGLAYTLSSPGQSLHWSAPIIFAGLIGFLSNLGIAECIGIIMETFDTSDLQPGANSRHREGSMASHVRRRRTNYSSFPRVTSGVFLAQTIGFLLAAAATGVGGTMTRNLSSQTATGIAAGVLLLITILLTVALYRSRAVQVVPNHAFGTRRNTKAVGTFNVEDDEYWKPVVIGNPSGKMRRMSLLEMGHMSRWTEIRKLNDLIKE